MNHNILWILSVLLSRFLNEECIYRNTNTSTAISLTCIHGICNKNNYDFGVCFCSFGYTGYDCNVPTRCLFYPLEINCSSKLLLPDPCNIENKCQNHGLCVCNIESVNNQIIIYNKTNSTGIPLTECRCSIGYKGKLCEIIEAEECNRCEVGNTLECKLEPISGTNYTITITCICKKSYYGTFCQYGEKIPMITLCVNNSNEDCANRTKPNKHCNKINCKWDSNVDAPCDAECKSDTCPYSRCNSNGKNFLRGCADFSFCKKRFSDSVCDKKCNTTECLFDGGDCNFVLPCQKKKFCTSLNSELSPNTNSCHSQICLESNCILQNYNYCLEKGMEVSKRTLEVKIGDNLLLLTFIGSKDNYLHNENNILKILSTLLNQMILGVATDSNGNKWIQEEDYNKFYSTSQQINLTKFKKNRDHINTLSRVIRSQSNVLFSPNFKQSSRHGSKRMVSVGYKLDPSMCTGFPCISDPNLAAEFISAASTQRKIFPMPLISSKASNSAKENKILNFLWFIFLIVIISVGLILISSHKLSKFDLTHTWYPMNWRTKGFNGTKINGIVRNQQLSRNCSLEPLLDSYDSIFMEAKNKKILLNLRSDEKILSTCLTSSNYAQNFHPLLFLFFNNLITCPEDILNYSQYINVPYSGRKVTFLMCAVTPSQDNSHFLNLMLDINCEEYVQLIRSYAAYNSKYIKSPIPSNILVSLLLQFGANVNAVTSDTNETALHFACKSSNIPLIKILLENGAEINCRDGNGRTPLHISISCFYVDTVVFLMKNNRIDLNIKDYLGMTPIMECSSRSQLYLVKLLLSSEKININLLNKEKSTALHLACSAGSYDICKLLIKHGACISKSDSFGRTPYMISYQNGFKNICDLLKTKFELL